MRRLSDFLNIHRYRTPQINGGDFAVRGEINHSKPQNHSYIKENPGADRVQYISRK